VRRQGNKGTVLKKETKMKKLFAMLILLSCVFCMFPQTKDANPAPKSAEPTLEETLEWINAKLKDELYWAIFNGGESHGRGLLQDNYILTWDSCKITLVYEKSYGYINVANERTTIKSEFQLSDLDLNSFEYSGMPSGTGYMDSGHMGRLKIYTTKKEDKINSNGVLENYIEVPVSKPEMVDRMNKAWKHAIKLCGGKETKEVF
jgi:hypothetical protein